MKKLLLILAAGLICSCQPSTKKKIEILEKVFAKTNFDVKIQTWGCFGGSEEYFSVSDEGTGYLLRSRRTGKSHIVSKAKIDSLRNYLIANIGKEDEWVCTLTENIRVGSFPSSVEYEHSDCDGVINYLLDYHSLSEE